MWVYFTPLYILGALLLLLGAFALLARLRGGRYLKPIIATLTKVPILERWITKGSKLALERQNPALAGAIRKLERAGADKDPQRAQQAVGRMTPAEKRAWLEAAGDQGALPTPRNRAERRRMERVRKDVGR